MAVGGGIGLPESLTVPMTFLLARLPKEHAGRQALQIMSPRWGEREKQAKSYFTLELLPFDHRLELQLFL